MKDDAVGGWGISYGGGAMLRTAGEGVPWAALSLFETWSDLYSALFPQDLPKSGRRSSASCRRSRGRRR